MSARALDDNRGMFPRLSAFVIWSFVAAAAMFWILRFVVHAPQAPAHAVAVDRSAPVRGDLTRLFGAPLVARAEEKAAAPSRYKLIGVMAPKSRLPEGSGAYGLALIAVDGKPARAYAVGSRLDSDLVLQSVGMRTASLGSEQGSRRMLLELPPPTRSGHGCVARAGDRDAAAVAGRACRDPADARAAGRSTLHGAAAAGDDGRGAGDGARAAVTGGSTGSRRASGPDRQLPQPVIDSAREARRLTAGTGGRRDSPSLRRRDSRAM